MYPDLCGFFDEPFNSLHLLCGGNGDMDMVLISQFALSMGKVTLERFDALKQITRAREIPRVYGAALTVETVFVLFISILIADPVPG